MKKSNIILLITIASVFSCLSIINFTLRAEYKKRNIKSVQKKIILPPFQHIQELKKAKKGETAFHPIIHIYQGGDTNQLTYYYYNPVGYEYFVKNDTLFIRADDSIENSFPMINIYCKNLVSISSNESEISLHNFISDSLELNSNQNSSITCLALTCNFLNISAKNKSAINISAKDTIQKVAMNVKNKAKLTLADAYFRTYTLTLDSTAILSTTGNSFKGINAYSTKK